jgi:hypothetical protein
MDSGNGYTLLTHLIPVNSTLKIAKLVNDMLYFTTVKTKWTKFQHYYYFVVQIVPASAIGNVFRLSVYL